MARTYKRVNETFRIHSALINNGPKNRALIADRRRLI